MAATDAELIRRARWDPEAFAERLASGLDSLPQDQRDALELRVIEERPYAEVASILGCTETAARLGVMRALGKLARFIPSQQSS